jgi:hypothetical protein
MSDNSPSSQVRRGDPLEPYRSTARLYRLLSVAALLSFCAVVLLTEGDIYRTFFFNNEAVDPASGMDTGMDFLNSIVCAHDGKPYTRYRTLYPPLANVFFALLAKGVPMLESLQWYRTIRFWQLRWTDADLRVHQSTLFPLLMFYVAYALSFVEVVERALVQHVDRARAVAVGLLLSYPSLYGIERGNVVLYVNLLALVFWFFRDSPHRVVRELSLLGLAVAAGFKLYPALLGLVLLFERHWARAARLVGYGVALLVLPFFYFEGADAIPIFLEVLFKYSARAALDGYGWANLTAVASQFTGSDLSAGMGPRLVGYALDAVLLLFAWRTRSDWKRGLYLVLVMILVQPTVAYSMLFLFIPLIGFLREEPLLRRENAVYFALFAVITLPYPVVGQILRSPHYTWKIASLQLALASLVAMALFDGVRELRRGAAAQQPVAVDAALI